MYPFRMYGRTIQLLRYEVTYTAEEPGEDGEMTQVQATERFPTIEEAEAAANSHTDAAVTSIDTSDCEWMDGLEVPDVPDTYSEAVKIYNMGDAAYQKLLAIEKRNSPVQIRADIDFVAIMQGVSL